MNVYFQISPVLHLIRVYCVLPFSNLNYNDSTKFIEINLISRFITLFIQLLVLFGYLLHAWETLQQISISPDSASVQETSTFASLLILHCVDIVNLINIIFLSQKLCNVLQKFLQKLQLIDNILNIVKYKRQHIIIYSILFVLVYSAKTTRLIYALDKMHITLRICPRIASGIFFAAEFLVIILCLELRYRLQIINIYLANKRITKIKNILKAFEVLRYSHDIINKNFGSFLLLNLSQLFMLILFGLLGLLIPCIAGLASPFGGPTDFSRCSSFAVILLDGITRFSLLIWACSSIYQEAERTAWLSSRILHRTMKEKTAHKLQSLLELSLVRRLKFSACGLFDIDLPLLFAAAGAIMSYLFLITQLK